MKVAFHTLGCKVNQYETEVIKEDFHKRGYELAEEGEIADVYVVNTCTVTSLADRKSRQFIRRAHNLNPDAVIAVTGCYAEIDPDKVKGIEGVSIITGTNGKKELADLVDGLLRERDSGDTGRSVKVDVKPYEELDKYEELGVITGMEGRTRAFIKIQEGCDRFCSYCIIPKARGKVRSRDKAGIIEEIKGLIEKGYKEIVLTGINTALYGRDLGMDGIGELISDIDKLPGDFRIRLSSLEPTVVDAEYAAGLLKYEKLCHHLHLSCQSGSDRVLERMNRGYTREDYLGIIRKIREIDPYFGFSTDLISGFPGETESDALDSEKLIREAAFVKTHVFKFSARKGTPAYSMEDQVPEPVKKERSARLIKAGDEIEKEFIEKNAGVSHEVLVERKEGSMLTGYTGNYIKAYIPEESGAATGSIVKVKLTSIYKDGAKAEYLGKIRKS